MPVNALIVGHSQTKYFSQYITDSTITILPYPGYQFNQLWNEIKDHVPKFKVIAIHCGINDLAKTEADEVAIRLETLLCDVFNVNPNAEILLSSVLPRSQNNFRGRQHSLSFLSDVNRRIVSFNDKLKDICESNIQLHYIGHPDFGKRKMLSRDGLHLSHAGTTQLVTDIINGINSIRDTKFANNNA